jgi:hypothetical protein
MIVKIMEAAGSHFPEVQYNDKKINDEKPIKYKSPVEYRALTKYLNLLKVQLFGSP